MRLYSFIYFFTVISGLIAVAGIILKISQKENKLYGICKKTIDFSETLFYNNRQKGGCTMLDNLVSWEAENGYKSKYVADKVGLSETQYSLMKHGKRKPSLAVAEAFQRVFKIENVCEFLKNYED